MSGSSFPEVSHVRFRLSRTAGRAAHGCAGVCGPNGQIFILNKRDGIIRLLVPDSKGGAR
jgi:hypothetical protein